MERTKYTPKRLLSLLLALIMLLGMFPTATLAAGEQADEPVVTPYDYKAFEGLTFEFDVGRLPERPYLPLWGLITLSRCSLYDYEIDMTITWFPN